MSCAALGSLWTKFCDSCSCSFGKFCDCSKNNVVVVGNTDNPVGAAAIAAILGAPDRDLRRDVQALEERDAEAQQIRRRAVRMQTLDDVEDREKEVLTGIIDVAKTCLREFGGEEMSKDEKWARFFGAGLLSNLDVQGKYRNKGFLTERERLDLMKEVETVCKYGSAAAFIWKLVKTESCKNGEDLEKLKRIGAITKKQFEILWDVFQRQGADAAIAADRFSVLDPALVPVFFRAANEYSSRSLAKIGFVAWQGLPRDMSHSAMNVLPSASQSGVDRRGPDDDAKDQGPSEAMRLFEELGGRGPKERVLQLGQLKAAVLCERLGIAADLAALSEREIASVRKAAPSLAKTEGAVCHVYYSLKSTKDPLTLKGRYGFSEAAVKRIKEEFSKNPHFFNEINLSQELAELSPAAIGSLWKIAEGFGEEFSAAMNRSYSAADWFDRAKGTPAYHAPTNSPQASAGSSAAAPAAAAAGPDEREEVDRAMRAMRESQQLRNSAPQDDRLRPIGHLNRGLVLAGNFQVVDPRAFGGDS